MAPRRSSFTPPFCPNPECPSHEESDTWRFKKKGFFRRKHGPRRVQRYVCQRCHRNFCTQTFDVSYWLHRTHHLTRIFYGLLGCSALRQIATELNVSPSTVQRFAERLGRHCLLFHENLRPRSVTEPLVLDGFRTFESGQFWPFDLNLLAGVSHFVYGVNEAELRRSGTHTPAQKRKRSELEAKHGRPDPQATRNAVAELIARIVPKDCAVTLHSDEHKAYPQAIARVPDRSIEHETISSKASRTAKNPLFPVNLADLLLRHTSANHKRETIAFSKRRQGAMYRAMVWMVWRNYLKYSSENGRKPPPGVALGVINRRLSVREVLSKRAFPWRQELSGWLEHCYFGRIPTRRMAHCVEHRKRFAH